MLDILGSTASNRLTIDVIHHSQIWNDLRRTFSQHMLAWQHATKMIIVLNAQARLSGWSIDNRQQATGPEELHPFAAELIARADPLIGRDLKSLSSERESPPGKSPVIRCRFESEKGEIAALINPFTRKLISVLPQRPEPTRQLPNDDKDLTKAQNSAWQLIVDATPSLAGKGALERARQAMKLSLINASIDSASNKWFNFDGWTRFGECDISLDEDSDQVLSWVVHPRQEESGDLTITDTQAATIAEPQMLSKKDVFGPEISRTTIGGETAIVVHWQHKIGDVEVAGDFTTVMINSTTGKIFGVSRKWREIDKGMLSEQFITADQALAAAERSREKSGVSPLAKGKVIGKAIVEIAADAEKPSPLRNVLVWRVGYRSKSEPRYWELYVDCKTGEIAGMTGF